MLSSFFACDKQKPLFEFLDSSETGIELVNKITKNENLNPLKFECIFNRAGLDGSKSLTILDHKKEMPILLVGKNLDFLQSFILKSYELQNYKNHQQN